MGYSYYFRTKDVHTLSLRFISSGIKSPQNYSVFFSAYQTGGCSFIGDLSYMTVVNLFSPPQQVTIDTYILMYIAIYI